MLRQGVWSAEMSPATRYPPAQPCVIGHPCERPRQRPAAISRANGCTLRLTPAMSLGIVLLTEEDPLVPGFTDLAAPFFAEAEKRRLPIFLTPVVESGPLNATPYLTSYECFRASAAVWPGRAPLVAALDATKRRLEAVGVTVEAMLIGGSFTELSKPRPQDIDCLMFYRWQHEDRSAPGAALGELQRLSKHHGVDVRFIPLDGDPLVLIKSVSYFTVLYSKLKEEDGDPMEAHLVRALLLVDCTNSAEAAGHAGDVPGQSGAPSS